MDVVLVTGAAGYIASHAVLAFRESGYRVIALDDLSSGYRFVVPGGIPFILGNAGDKELVSQLLKDYDVSVVAHFAGSVIVQESIENPLKYYENNTCVSYNLIETCVKVGIQQFIFSSTAAVYGAPSTGVASEESCPSPISPYAASKLAAEWILRDTAAAHRLPYMILRYFNVAGADPAGRSGQNTPNSTHLIKVVSEAAVGKRKHVDIFGSDYDTPDGTCIRDYVHVSDLSVAHVKALEHLQRGGESLILNCGYGHGYSVRQVIAAAEKQIGSALNVRVTQRRKGDAASLIANASKIQTCLNWSPRYDDLDTIIRTSLAWERRDFGQEPN